MCSEGSEASQRKQVKNQPFSTVSASIPALISPDEPAINFPCSRCCDQCFLSPGNGEVNSQSGIKTPNTYDQTQHKGTAAAR